VRAQLVEEFALQILRATPLNPVECDLGEQQVDQLLEPLLAIAGGSR